MIPLLLILVIVLLFVIARHLMVIREHLSKGA